MNTSTALCLASGGVAIGKALQFGEVHGAITHVLGWDVFTHELADKQVWITASELVRAACPAIIPFADRLRDAKGNGEVCQLVCDEAEAALGKTVEIPKGTGERRESPLESLERIAPGKPVIVVET